MLAAWGRMKKSALARRAKLLQVLTKLQVINRPVAVWGGVT
jgi:hypothetical protein